MMIRISQVRNLRIWGHIICLRSQSPSQIESEFKCKWCDYRFHALKSSIYFQKKKKSNFCPQFQGTQSSQTKWKSVMEFASKCIREGRALPAISFIFFQGMNEPKILIPLAKELESYYIFYKSHLGQEVQLSSSF